MAELAVKEAASLPTVFQMWEVLGAGELLGLSPGTEQLTLWEILNPAKYEYFLSQAGFSAPDQ